MNLDLKRATFLKKIKRVAPFVAKTRYLLQIWRKGEKTHGRLVL